MKILAVANQKGGVGKTTLTIHLGQYAAEHGKRVLLVDLDDQASLSGDYFQVTSGMKASSLFADTVCTDLPFRVSENLSVLRGDDTLRALEQADPGTNIKTLKEALRAFDNDFDLCLFDIPGAIGTRMICALAVANCVVTPVNVGLFEMKATAKLLAEIRRIKTSGQNPKLKHIGILPMKTNTRSPEEMKSLDDLRAMYGTAILPHILMERAAVKKAVGLHTLIWNKVRGETHRKAAEEWQNACAAVLRAV